MNGSIARRDRTWIVVADGAHVTAIETAAGDPQLHTVEDMHSSTELPPTHELVRDRLGRSFESVGSARHAKDGRTDPHREPKRQFAKKVPTTLRASFAEGRFEHIILSRHRYARGSARRQDAATQAASARANGSAHRGSSARAGRLPSGKTVRPLRQVNSPIIRSHHDVVFKQTR